MKSLIQRRKDTQFGSYTISGTRIRVGIIKAFYLGGESVAMIAGIYEITEEQVLACINFRKK